jgi:ATP-dependent Clp protease adaptor protein ClpS
MSSYTKHSESVDVDILEQEQYKLIVWNDDVNTFEFVAETLVQVCGHTWEQAEQCAMLIHYKGKYAVLHGELEDLKPKCEMITSRQITATVE